VTTINFPTNAARYIRVTQTGSAPGLFWSVYEFNVYGTSGTAPATPTGLAANGGDTQAALSWNASATALGYNLKRSTISNGTFSVIASNLTMLSFTNTGLTDGTTYYYVVSATNTVGESTNSSAVSVQPVSMVSAPLSMGISGGQLQLTWPQDHTGWSLQVQTNVPGAGLGSNWVTIPLSTSTNQMSFPINLTNGGFFARLVYP